MHLCERDGTQHKPEDCPTCMTLILDSSSPYTEEKKNGTAHPSQAPGRTNSEGAHPLVSQVQHFCLLFSPVQELLQLGTWRDPTRASPKGMFYLKNTNSSSFAKYGHGHQAWQEKRTDHLTCYTNPAIYPFYIAFDWTQAANCVNPVRDTKSDLDCEIQVWREVGTQF